MFFSRRLFCTLLLAVCFCFSCQPNAPQSTLTDWQMGPFEKQDQVNPILEAQAGSVFYCPVREDSVAWEFKDVFNPAALVLGQEVILLYRAEDTVGIHQGTSRIGLARSPDGLRFSREAQPILFPERDSFQIFEWEGGCEDPRIVRDESGGYVMTYTAYDGKTARLCVATSPDLYQWQKYGPVFSESKWQDHWSKAGAIVCRKEGSKLIATRIQGRYCMYWGDTDLFAATSEDLRSWEPVLDDSGALKKVFSPRPGKFDSRLVESGPPPILTEQGILLLYNGMTLPALEGSTPGIPPDTYTCGQALLDTQDPTRLLQRSETPFLVPDKPYEIDGQVNRVCFIQGWAFIQDQVFLYYGTADSRIAVAVAPSSST